MAERDFLGSLVEEKMEDKDNYSAMLNYFDSRYGSDSESTNYANVIKSMKRLHNVSSLVDTYNKVLRKLLIFAYGSEEYISELWVEYGLTCDYQWVWEDLKSFLNDQIKRVFDETEYSDNLALECITNLRKGSNDATLRKYIVSKSSEEVNAALKQIEACEMTVHEAPKHMSQFNIETNDYREYKPKYIRDIKYLIKNGYHRGYDDVYYEIKSKISYIPDTKTLVYIILSCIVLVPIIMLLMEYAFLGIFGLVCILALIKMIK